VETNKGAGLFGDTVPPKQQTTPASTGVICARCRGVTFRTSWQTFSNGTKHIRMECAVCKAFVKYLKQQKEDGTPGYRHEPAVADANESSLKAPTDGEHWLGYVRQSDGVWRGVALAADLGGCWEALLTYPGDGDRLACPVAPVKFPEAKAHEETRP
jgi:hypothetical protein